MPNTIVREWARAIGGRRAGAVAVALAAFGAGMLHTSSSPTAYLPEVFGLGAVPRPVLAAVVAIALLTALWTSHRGFGPLAAVAFAAPATDSTAAWVCLAAYCYLVGAYRDRFRIVGHTAAATLAAVLPTAVGLLFDVPGSAPADLTGALGGAALFAWFPLVLGLWAAARRQVVVGLRERAERLDRERLVVAERARTAERTRIAHDMHDVVAHQVSLMVLHAGGLEVNATDAATAATAGLIRTTGAEALEQLRHVLGVLRGPGTDVRQPTIAAVEDLVADSVRAGVPVVLRPAAAGRPLARIVEQAVYHVVREGLTNVHKHAGQVFTEAVIDRSEGRLTVRIRNAPPPTPRSAGAGSGTGLIGLRERLSLLDGELHAAPTRGGGFELRAVIPERSGEPL